MFETYLRIRFSKTANTVIIISLFYTKVTVKPVPYLDFHLEIDNEVRLKTNLYDKKDGFSFPVVTVPFLCQNIPVASAYGVHISKLIRYSKDSISHHDFLNRSSLLPRKLLNQQFKVLKQKSFRFAWTVLQVPNERDDGYGISVLQMIADMFLKSLLQSRPLFRM